MTLPRWSVPLPPSHLWLCSGRARGQVPAQAVATDTSSRSRGAAAPLRSSAGTVGSAGPGFGAVIRAFISFLPTLALPLFLTAGFFSLTFCLPNPGSFPELSAPSAQPRSPGLLFAQGREAKNCPTLQ